jgi:predicted phosphodiesterase
MKFLILLLLAAMAPVYGSFRFTGNTGFEVDGIKVLMTHIGGFPGKYDARALKKIIDTKPNIFVCGHSHILRVMYDKHFDTLVMNPGAAGLQGFHQVRTLLRFEITEGEIKNMEVIEFPR